MWKLFLIFLLLCLPTQASREFDGVDDSVLVNVGVVTAAPFTMCADFKVDTVGAVILTVAFIGDKDANAQHYTMQTDNNDYVLTAFSGAGSNAAFILDILTVGPWHRGCGVIASATDRRVFINGGNKATNTNSSVPAGVDNTTAGRTMEPVPTRSMDGSIANFVIWNVALSDTEVASLGDVRGMHPCKMRPASIVLWWPLGIASPEPDWSTNTNNGTVTGALVSDNPPNPPCLAGE